jgi:hypothetical protein
MPTAAKGSIDDLRDDGGIAQNATVPIFSTASAIRVVSARRDFLPLTP